MKGHNLSAPIPHSRLLELLSYSPSEGVFRWKLARKNVVVGSIAGTPHCEGYVSISVERQRCLAHRLAWYYVHGVWPMNDIDHVNRVRSDNRIENLRLATRKENMENQGLRSDNTSGHRGVGWDSQRCKWKAQIRHNKQTIMLGRFDDLEQALIARKQAESKLFTHVEVEA